MIRMSETLQHLVLVRHGKSEGDERREAWQSGKPFVTSKTPDEEGLVPLGYAESGAAGGWIERNITARRMGIRLFRLVLCGKGFTQ